MLLAVEAESSPSRKQDVESASKFVEVNPGIHIVTHNSAYRLAQKPPYREKRDIYHVDCVRPNEQ